MVFAGHHVGDDFRLLRIGYAGFENADDRGNPLVNAPEANGFADDVRILLESSGPETISQNHHAGGLGAVVLGANETPKNGVETHDLEIVAADYSRLNFARLAEPHHRKTNLREVAK